MGFSDQASKQFVVTQSEHLVLSKAQVRQKILSKIKANGSSWASVQGEKFSKNLLPILVSKPGVWGGYRPMKDEPQLDLMSLLGIGSIAFPLTEGLNLEFRKFITQWKTSELGFESPRDGEAVPLENLVGLLIPCVGLSPRGVRLGRGAGFYDRALAEKATSDKILKIGICYDFGYSEEVPEEVHDLIVDIAVTESKIILFNLKFKNMLVEMGIPFVAAIENSVE